MKECLDPVWDEPVEFLGAIDDFRGSELLLKVCDRDVLKHDDAMGDARVSLRALGAGHPMEFFEALATEGRIMFSVSWEAVPPHELRPVRAMPPARPRLRAAQRVARENSGRW